MARHRIYFGLEPIHAVSKLETPMGINTDKIVIIREGDGVDAKIKVVDESIAYSGRGLFVATVTKIHISLSVSLSKTFKETDYCGGKEIKASRTATLSLNASETFDVCGCGFPIETTFPATIRNEGNGVVYLPNGTCKDQSYNESETLQVPFRLVLILPEGSLDGGLICYDPPSINNLCDRPIYDSGFFIPRGSHQSPFSGYPVPPEFQVITFFTGCMYPQRSYSVNYLAGGDSIGSARLNVRVETM